MVAKQEFGETDSGVQEAAAAVATQPSEPWNGQEEVTSSIDGDNNTIRETDTGNSLLRYNSDNADAMICNESVIVSDVILPVEDISAIATDRRDDGIIYDNATAPSKDNTDAAPLIAAPLIAAPLISAALIAVPLIAVPLIATGSSDAENSVATVSAKYSSSVMYSSKLHVKDVRNRIARNDEKKLTFEETASIVIETSSSSSSSKSSSLSCDEDVEEAVGLFSSSSDLTDDVVQQQISVAARDTQLPADEKNEDDLNRPAVSSSSSSSSSSSVTTSSSPRSLSSHLSGVVDGGSEGEETLVEILVEEGMIPDEGGDTTDEAGEEEDDVGGQSPEELLDDTGSIFFPSTVPIENPVVDNDGIPIGGIAAERNHVSDSPKKTGASSDTLPPSALGAAQSVSSAVENFIARLCTQNQSLCRKTLYLSLEDCYGRFILNLPDQYLTKHIQLCFAIQEAYWWYEDYWYDELNSKLPKLSMRNFGFLLCEKCPLLRLYFNSSSYAVFMNHWREYCQTIPLKGAILINDDLTKVLMVQGWRGGRWMFPRGKVDELEDDVSCAVREVREEVGVDVARMINPNVYIETSIDDEQPLKLFLIPGVLESTPFGPRKRKEISRIRWIPISRLPGWKRWQLRTRLKTKTKDAATTKPIAVSAASDKKSSENPAASNCLSLSDTTKSLSEEAVLISKLQENVISNGDREHPRFWNVHPFADSLFGWLHLLQKGLKTRIPSPTTVATDVNSNWSYYHDIQGVYSFPAPPTGFNQMLKDRHSKLFAEERYTEFLKAPRSSSNKTGTTADTQNDAAGVGHSGARLTKHRVSLTSLASCQPAAPKPPALPPYINNLKWYGASSNTSLKLMNHLRHPHISGKREQRLTSSEFRQKTHSGESRQQHWSKAVVATKTATPSKKSGASSTVVTKILKKQQATVAPGTSLPAGERTPFPLLEIGTLGTLEKTATTTTKTRSILQEFVRIGIQVGASPIKANGTPDYKQPLDNNTVAQQKEAFPILIKIKQQQENEQDPQQKQQQVELDRVPPRLTVLPPTTAEPSTTFLKRNSKAGEESLASVASSAAAVKAYSLFDMPCIVTPSRLKNGSFSATSQRRRSMLSAEEQKDNLSHPYLCEHTTTWKMRTRSPSILMRKHELRMKRKVFTEEREQTTEQTTERRHVGLATEERVKVRSRKPDHNESESIPQQQVAASYDRESVRLGEVCLHLTKKVSSTTPAIYHGAVVPPQTEDTAAAVVQDISSLAVTALNAVNTCRKRVGQPILAPEEFVDILGLDC